ncbi:hypothetical protein PRIPAC_93329 [Pristionchus pacificus]|uniref:COMM domain-containing protein n=1 Tax=Pristionchus pacificus TaxID=54126 RepID=A0A454XWP1_PRIPA|nr:hypothetical protein PRIPAC_93329 [Pristionchus pacificus]|eukprot:PDM63078.1 hypothetical protein PRIPAC_50293 [Pristionchus pacificus]
MSRAIDRLPEGTTVSVEDGSHLMTVLLGETSLSASISKDVAIAVWNVWREGVENGWTEIELSDRIKEKKGALVDALTTPYKDRLADLRKHFASIRYDDSTVVDSEWIVTKEKESGSSGLVGRKGRTTCEFNLKYLAAGKVDTEELKLNMNKEELQDLYWTLKKAQNQMNKIAQG